MAVISTAYTQGALKKIQREMNLISRVINIVMGVFALGFYTFMICVHVSDVPRLVIYSVLLAVAAASFIGTIALMDDLKEEESQEKRKIIRRRYKNICKMINYLARLTAVIYALVFYFVGGGKESELVVIILSATLLMLNLASDFVIDLGKRYIRFLRVAIIADYNASALPAFIDPVGRFRSFTDEKAGNKEPKTKQDKKDQALADEFVAGHKEDVKEKRRNDWQRIKDNLRKIFKGDEEE